MVDKFCNEKDLNLIEEKRNMKKNGMRRRTRSIGYKLSNFGLINFSNGRKSDE